MTRRLKPSDFGPFDFPGCTCCERLDSEEWSDFDRGDSWYCKQCREVCNEPWNERLVGEPCRVLVDDALRVAQVAAELRGAA